MKTGDSGAFLLYCIRRLEPLHYLRKEGRERGWSGDKLSGWEENLMGKR